MARLEPARLSYRADRVFLCFFEGNSCQAARIFDHLYFIAKLQEHSVPQWGTKP